MKFSERYNVCSAIYVSDISKCIWFRSFTLFLWMAFLSISYCTHISVHINVQFSSFQEYFELFQNVVIFYHKGCGPTLFVRARISAHPGQTSSANHRRSCIVVIVQLSWMYNWCRSYPRLLLLRLSFHNTAGKVRLSDHANT